MDLKEYRRRHIERQARLVGGAATCAGAADQIGHWYLLDVVQDYFLTLPWHGGITLAATGAALVGTSFWTRQRRNNPHQQNLRTLRAPEWAGARDRRDHIGLTAARRQARQARPDLSTMQRLRARASEVGIDVGTTLSGPPRARGHHIVIPWDTGGALGRVSKSAVIADLE